MSEQSAENAQPHSECPSPDDRGPDDDLCFCLILIAQRGTPPEGDL